MKTVFLAHVFVAGSLLTYNVNGQSTSAGGDGGAGGKHLFLDVHQLDAAKVTGKDVAAAHQKDLAMQKKYGVNLVNYWVDEKEGIVMCLAQAKDSMDLIKTHKEAHGLLPARVMMVKEGN